jgi:hypothetical protein
MGTEWIGGNGFMEETEGCDSEPLPFKFKYFFTKDPCKKCLVRPACNTLCEPRYALRDQRQSIRAWKDKWRRFFIHTPLTIQTTIFIITIALLLILVNSGCRQVNHDQANQYYEQHVKNFPEENP